MAFPTAVNDQITDAVVTRGAANQLSVPRSAAPLPAKNAPSADPPGSPRGQAKTARAR